MTIKHKVKVLIVDDGVLFCETLARKLALDRCIEVVGIAGDAYEARDKILEFKPDVLTIKIDLPKLNGIEFLQRLLPQYPLPVVILNEFDERIFDALNVGAVDYVIKSDFCDIRKFETMANELLIKIKIASTAKVGYLKKDYNSKNLSKTNNNTGGLIAIGASTGGTEAIAYILKALPREMPGIVIVQHMPPNFTKIYAERLNNSCLLEVKEAEDGDHLYPGRVLIAPGEHQMTVLRYGNNYRVKCYKGERVNGHCPSIDVLFESVSQQAGEKAIGIILTGMGADGANGLLLMRQRGAKTIGQDRDSSVVYGMPKVAMEIGALDFQIGLSEIPSAIYSCISEL